MQADAIFDECLDIADDVRHNTNEAVQRSRLRIYTRKWMAGKFRPKKYGERLDLAHSGPDGGPLETKDVTNVELARRIAFIFDQAAREPHRSGKPRIEAMADFNRVPPPDVTTIIGGLVGRSAPGGYGEEITMTQTAHGVYHEPMRSIGYAG